MSSTKVPEKTKLQLWIKAGGRCEYPGCNQILWRDDLTKAVMNKSYIAHIVADKPNGPRGDKILSKKLSKDIDNLMLLCDTHHRLIDIEKVEVHPADKLRVYKKKHEDRIERLSSILEEKKSFILLYGANIGEQSSPLNKIKAFHAVAENGYYPAESDPIELSLKNSVLKDENDDFWRIEKNNLDILFRQKIKDRLCDGIINHLSIFGIAPQPLLIYLGSLLSDIPAAELYQLHRSPPDWVWQENDNSVSYKTLIPEIECSDIALIFSLSQKIDTKKVFEVLGKEVPICQIFIPEPNNEFLKDKRQLEEFRVVYKKVLSEIKYRNNSSTILHVFSAAPVTIAIEIGRARLPKVDLPMALYDYNKKNNGFHKAIEIK